MRRYLVVANQTLQRAELADELRSGIEAVRKLVLPARPGHPGGGLSGRGRARRVPCSPAWTWWMTDYRGPATDEQASTQARQRLGQMLADLNPLDVPVEGDLGSAQPLEAMEKVFTNHRFDEIIVATLPRPVSRWLRPTCPIGPSAGSGCRSRPSSPSAGPEPRPPEPGRQLACVVIQTHCHAPSPAVWAVDVHEPPNCTRATARHSGLGGLQIAARGYGVYAAC